MKRTLVLILLIVVAACGEQQWVGTLYQDREDFTTAEEFGNFSDLDSCTIAANKEIEKIRQQVGGEFVAGGKIPGWECGTNCKRDDAGDLLCKRVEAGGPEIKLN